MHAVVTGVQIHNWGERFDDDSPNLEFVAPSSVYVVVDGEKTHVDLGAMPSLTPHQVGGGGGLPTAHSAAFGRVVVVVVAAAAVRAGRAPAYPCQPSFARWLAWVVAAGGHPGGPVQLGGRAWATRARL